jgi:hypothetical protein
MWPKPGEKKPAKKLSYIKRAKMPNGETVLVGAGIYAQVRTMNIELKMNMRMKGDVL